MIFASSAPDWPQGPNAKAMSKNKEPEETMRDEYEFDGGVRGKYSSRFAEGTNIVVLDPDVAEVFGDAKAVNEALRLLAGSARKSEKERAS